MPLHTLAAAQYNAFLSTVAFHFSSKLQYLMNTLYIVFIFQNIQWTSYSLILLCTRPQKMYVLIAPKVHFNFFLLYERFCKKNFYYEKQRQRRRPCRLPSLKTRAIGLVLLLGMITKYLEVCGLF